MLEALPRPGALDASAAAAATDAFARVAEARFTRSSSHLMSQSVRMAVPASNAAVCSLIVFGFG